MKYFLGNSVEEAKETHDLFVKTINHISREYSLRTGIDKTELFNEAFVALRNAKINYDPNKGGFKTYAVATIRRHLNDFIRDNSGIAIPRYMQRAVSLLRRVQALQEANNYESPIENFINEDYNNITYKQEELIALVTHLRRIAERAGVTLEKLVKRATHIPNDNYLPHNEIELAEGEPENNEIKIMINTILDKLNGDKLTIAIRIMEGESKKQIARELRKSDTWVSNQLKEIRALVYPALKDI